jgi:hypothetical protein
MRALWVENAKARRARPYRGLHWMNRRHLPRVPQKHRVVARVWLNRQNLSRWISSRKVQGRNSDIRLAVHNQPNLIHVGKVILQIDNDLPKDEAVGMTSAQPERFLIPAYSDRRDADYARAACCALPAHRHPSMDQTHPMYEFSHPEQRMDEPVHDGGGHTRPLELQKGSG